MKSVLVMGDATMDATILVQSYPPPLGGSITSPAPIFEAGGSGANVALALARLAVRVSLVSKLGDDVMGRLVRDYLVNEGVDVSYVYTTSGAYTPLILVLVDPTGERSFIACTRGSSQAQIHPEEAELIDLSRFHWLHITGVALVAEPTRASVLRVMQNASSQKIPISLDLNLRIEYRDIDEEFRKAIQRAVELSDFILGSSEELAFTLPGMTSESNGTFLPTTHVLITRRGVGGAAAIDAFGSVNAPAYQVEVASTKGAGDAFDAGFIFSHLEGYNLETALYWGNATAALTIGKPGSYSPPARSQVEDLMANSATYSTEEIPDVERNP